MSIELNAGNFKSIAKQVIKKYDLNVRTHFPGVSSKHTIQTAPDCRYSIEVCEKELNIRKEMYKNPGQWIAVSFSRYTGPSEVVERKYAEVVKALSEKA